jgi:hypothetical protein
LVIKTLDSELDPDPQLGKMLDPDPHLINADPQPWDSLTTAKKGNFFSSIYKAGVYPLFIKGNKQDF